MTGLMSRGSGLGRAKVIAAAMGIAAMTALPSAAAETVRYGLAAVSLSHAPTLLSRADASIFAAHDLALEVTDFRGSANNCVAALLSDSVDLCQIGTTTGIDAIAEGADLVAIAVTTGPVGEIVLSSASASKLPVAIDGPIEERLRALKGLRIVSGGTGTTNFVLLRKMLADVGLSTDDIQHSVLTDPAAMLENLRHDRIDGAIWGSGATGRMLEEGVAVRWITTSSPDLPQISSIPFVTIFAKRSWVEANQDKAEKVNRALADAIGRVVSDFEGSAKVLREAYFPDLDEAIFKDGLTQSVAAAGNFPDAKAKAHGWDVLLELQRSNTGKDYSNAAFDKVVAPFARAQ